MTDLTACLTASLIVSTAVKHSFCVFLKNFQNSYTIYIFLTFSSDCCTPALNKGAAFCRCNGAKTEAKKFDFRSMCFRLVCVRFAEPLAACRLLPAARLLLPTSRCLLKSTHTVCAVDNAICCRFCLLFYQCFCA